MASLAVILSATLSPDAQIRKQAERELEGAKAHAEFGPAVLQLAQDSTQDKSVRQSAALAFKNWIKTNWAVDDAPTPLTTTTAETLKASLVSIMISLSSEPALQVQVGEAISVIAEADFPEQWEGLIEQLVSSLSPTDFVVNNAVLQTAHSIFRRWRAQFRTDTLFLEIKFVLERFCEPYLALFQQTDALISSPSLTPAMHATLLKTLLLLFQIYHDLNSQDLPEFFEDRLPEFMGLLLKYLDYGLTPASANEEEDDDVTDLEKIKAEICEVATLYSLRYLDALQEGKFLGPFVEKTWGLLSKLGSGVKYDILVAKAAGFLGVVVKMPSQRALFEQPQTLEAFCEKIMLPNMTLRTFEEEMFEDDVMEYVRRDLEGSNSETRRQAAADFTKALMEQFENQITAIVTQYVGAYLTQYAADPKTNWKSKDTALFLLTSIASRGSTVQQGVTSTNALVDVIKFFSDHVLSDLQAPAGTVHPIIQADAIKFLYTFRNQLTKEQLLSVLPLLVPHLENSSFVIHTYAAATIEKILCIKQKGALLFGQADIRPYSESILNALFKIIESGGTPQLIAANDRLMMCALRVIITSRQALTPNFVGVLGHLTKILTEISKNSSNSRFNHFTFESIAALIRFVTAGSPSTLHQFEAALFPLFHAMLQQDESEFSPFVFQILSQLLELHGPQDFPDAYKALLPPLLTPTLWEQRGNVPALVRLLRAFLSRGAVAIVEANQLPAMLGIFDYLIKSKVNDTYGFELLEALLEFVPMYAASPFSSTGAYQLTKAPLSAALRQYMSNPIFVLLLTRLQTSKTPKFSQGLLRFICFAAAIEKEGLDPDGVIAMVDGCQPQPGLFAQLLPVLLPDVQTAPTKNRKIIAVGLGNLLSKSKTMLSEPSIQAWTPTMQALLKLFLLPLPLAKNTGAEDEIEIADPEDIGYQSAFSKLGASEKAPVDPVAYVPEPRTYLATSLVATSVAFPGQIQNLVLATGPEFAGPFLSYLSSNGYERR